MEDEIDFPFHEQVIRDIVVDKLEARISGEVRNVVGAARDQVVNADHGVSLCNQPITEMRAEEAGAASNYRDGHGEVGLDRNCGMIE
jgi:hypothetical protein